jgi:uncharacterized membrane protein HdeD (DUF308 family)
MNRGGTGGKPMLNTWWKRVLTGILAIAFGLCAIAFPAGILVGRILDVIFGQAKPYSASMTAVGALLALVAWVAIDGLVHLLGTSANDKRTARVRGAAGVAIAIAAIIWPGQTAYISVELIGLWAILVGVLELYVAGYSREKGKDRAFLILAAIASILVGVGVMIWAFVGAVVISASVGVAAVARGVSLMMSGISERNQLDKEQAAA